jgi:8-hydroxy-5-deazaflavin:NADPH oxidoreductase
VEIVDHDPVEAQKLAGELGESATAVDPGAPFGGDVVVFAVYYPGIKDPVQQYADRFAGKVVVDIANPVDTQTWDQLATAPGTSSPEELTSSFRRGRPS